jgi:hypothetical protein
MADQNKTNKILLWVVVGVLIALNALFISNYLNTKEEKKKVESQLVDTEKAKKALEDQVADVRAKLDELQGENQKLNTLIDEQKKDLDERAAKIRTMLAKGNLDQKEIDRLMSDIRKLNNIIAKANYQRDSLTTANAALKSQNMELLENVKTVSDKNENLTVENTGLKNKVAVASVLKTENISAKTFQVKESGKEKETSKSGSVNRLKISFNLGDNFVAEKNQKVIYMKIITPGGATIPSPEKGTFTFQGSETTYTQKINFQFTNTRQQIQLVWDKGSTTLAKGNYKVELYCEGFIIGNGNFDLK